MQQNQKYFALADADGKLANRFLLVSNLETADPARDRRRQRARAARAARRRASSSSTRTARRALDARVAELAQRRLSQQARHAGGARRAHARARRRRSRAMIGADAGARRPRGAARQGRSRHRHGRRVPGAAGTDGPLLRRARRRAARGGRRDRAALLAALRRRRAAGRSGRAGGRARRQARDARRHVRHRQRADRRQGPVRPAPRRARRDPHPGRAAAAAGACRTSSRRRSPPSATVPAVQARARRPRGLHLRPPARLPARARLHGQPDRGRASTAARRASTSCRRGSRPCGRSQQLPEAEALAAANKRIVNILRKSGGEAAGAVDRARLDRRRRARPVPGVPEARRRRSTRLCAAGDFAGALLALATAQARRRPRSSTT